MTSDTPQAALATGTTECSTVGAKPARVPHVGSGRAQLSLVEHALCPLDPVASLRDHLIHGTTYGYRDREGRLVMASVRVTCPSGLSAADEFTLWGLLAWTFSQQEPSTEFHATPHYCLRQLGLIESNGSKGGRDYQLFRETVSPELKTHPHFLPEGRKIDGRKMGDCLCLRGTFFCHQSSCQSASATVIFVGPPQPYPVDVLAWVENPGERVQSEA